MNKENGIDLVVCRTKKEFNYCNNLGKILESKLFLKVTDKIDNSNFKLHVFLVDNGDLAAIVYSTKISRDEAANIVVNELNALMQEEENAPNN